jgi:hypothetical protein
MGDSGSKKAVRCFAIDYTQRDRVQSMHAGTPVQLR